MMTLPTPTPSMETSDRWWHTTNTMINNHRQHMTWHS
jgi:hypothetical protein